MVDDDRNDASAHKTPAQSVSFTGNLAVPEEAGAGTQLSNGQQIWFGPSDHHVRLGSLG